MFLAKGHSGISFGDTVATHWCLQRQLCVLGSRERNSRSIWWPGTLGSPCPWHAGWGENVVPGNRDGETPSMFLKVTIWNRSHSSQKKDWLFWTERNWSPVWVPKLWKKSASIARQADVVAALSLEVLKGSTRAFDSDVHKIRPHPGQIAVAKRLRSLLQFWNCIHRRSQKVIASVTRVQDAYTTSVLSTGSWNCSWYDRFCSGNHHHRNELSHG